MDRAHAPVSLLGLGGSGLPVYKSKRMQLVTWITLAREGGTDGEKWQRLTCLPQVDRPDEQLRHSLVGDHRWHACDVDCNMMHSAAIISLQQDLLYESLHD